MTDQADPTPAEVPHLLTRERLLDGSVQRMCLAVPELVLLTDAERERSLHAVLQSRPAPGEPVWLFGYGSLVWNPTIRFVESRVARVEGWQRSFCLSTPVGRGTPENPGIVLALDRGGNCTGAAFRIAEDILEEELGIVWRREMLTGAYVPRWVTLRNGDGQAFGHGIAFTINTAGLHYVAGLSEDEAVRRLATAAGQLGTASDYLFHTQAGLRKLGIVDPLIERLAVAVIRAQSGARTEVRPEVRSMAAEKASCGR